MKDNEFDDIGKRLYDLEADPPKDGWEKIAPAINTPQQPGIIGGLRKNGWKFLIILIPVSIYLLYSGQNGKPSASSSSLVPGIVEDQAVEKSASLPAEGLNSDILTESSAAKSFESISAEGDSVEPNQQKTLQTKTVAIADPTINQLVPDEHLKTMNNNVDLLPGAHENDIDMDEENKIADGHTDKSVNVILGQTKVRENNETVLPFNFNTQSTEVIDSTVQEQKLRLLEEESPDTTSSKEIVAGEEKKSLQRAWRVTASIMPHYLIEAARPVVNDDVFVTNIDKSGSPTRIGIGFALGAGKAITPDFYIDGQLSYTEMEQHISFSYATGKVDTLLAVQQPDQSVRVTPVYQVNNREISSKFSYGGVRLGGTYYFWSTPRRRFDINATAGAHYLISSHVTEKTAATAASLSNENLNTMNYSFMVGVGYNLNLNKGWELMINPSLTYYLRKVKDAGLPYNLNQQSFGANIMLSKTLGKQ